MNTNKSHNDTLDRWRAIDAALNSKIGLHVRSVAAAFDWTDETIRGDLETFAKQGYLASSHRERDGSREYTLWHYDDRLKPEFKPMFADQVRGLKMLDIAYALWDGSPPAPYCV